MTRTYLFIGGSRDGQWRPVEKPDHFIYVPQDVKPQRIDEPMSTPIRLPPLETYTRKAVTYSNNNTMYDLYVIHNVTGDAMVKMLIEGYRRP